MDKSRKLFDNMLSTTAEIVIRVEELKGNRKMGLKDIIGYSEKEYHMLVI